MKKTMIMLAVALIAAAGVYAEGRQEDPLASSRNKVALTGTLQFADGLPVINADGKTYNLFAPRLMRQAYTLKPGTALSVEGYVVQPPPRMQKDGTPSPASKRDSVLVRKVTIDGKTFETTGRGEGRGQGRMDSQRGFHRDGPRCFGEGPRHGFGDKGAQGYGKDWEEKRGNR